MVTRSRLAEAAERLWADGVVASFEHHREIGSTNDDAKRWSKSFDPSPTSGWHLVTTDRQTAGRGRRGRRFDSDSGTLTFTLGRRFIPDPNGGIWFAVASAVADALRDVLGPESDSIVTVKPPNDVLVDRKKVVGILIERTAQATIIGIGLNVQTVPTLTDRRDENAPPPGCLGTDINIADVLNAVVRHTTAIHPVTAAPVQSP